MRNWLIIFGLTVLIILVRSINLLGQPLYLDEGIYIFWAHLFSQDPGYAYVSLQDGKTPLFFWLVSWLQPTLHNSLLTARLISVVAGGITALSWMTLLYKKANFKSAIWTGILFLILPYGFLIERLGLVDSLLTALSSLSLLFLILAFDNPAWAIISGITLAVAYMTKTTARLILVSELVISLWFIYQQKGQWKKIILTGLSFLIVAGIYKELASYMQVGAYRFWDMIQNKEADLTFSLPQIFYLLTHKPLSYLEFSGLVLEYTAVYLSGIFLLAMAGAIWVIKKSHRWLWLVGYVLILYFGILLSGRVMASRYIYLAAPPVVALAGLGIIWLKNLKKDRLIWAILIIVSLQSLLLMLHSPLAIYSHDDRAYFAGSDLTADGLNQVINYIKANPNKPVLISATWGVGEGSQVLMSEQGITAKLTKVADATKSAGFLYDTDTKDVDWLKLQPNIQLIQQFPRLKNSKNYSGLFIVH